MPKKSEILQKLEYIGLDLDDIPKTLNEETIEYRVPKFYDESQYKQYRYVKVKDIQILLTPTNRLEDLEEKYKKSSPLSDYLDGENEENYLKHTTFLNMLKNVDIDKIEEIEKEQDRLSKNIPFKVKFSSNYLWQIYYSNITGQYFMLVPTEDSEYEAFFYLLKKKLENKRMAKIFVPICGVDYTNDYLRKTEYQDIENYIWLFTKDWPLIYEVYDKSEKLSIQIIGQTNVYGKVKSLYKIKLENKEEATSFYKLLKAIFILQTELPNYFEFKTNINNDGGLDFYCDNNKINYIDISGWLKEQYLICEQKKKDAEELIKTNTEKLENLKSESVLLDIEYIDKEKQISTFLECKKSFFGKVKYFFKFSKGKKTKDKKANKKNLKIKQEVKEEKIEEEEIIVESSVFIEKANYTIDELIQNYKYLQQIEENVKNLVLDINALKLKNKNLKKKIENASIYIKEIDSHKKSIFEFWKYSNKDEMASLPEGEEEEVNVVKKIVKVFDYEEDLELFGKKYDRYLRKTLSQDQTDAVFITSTDILDILNKIKNNEILPKDLDNNLKQIKKEALSENKLFEYEEFDIFGGTGDATKISKIRNHKHREIAKDKFRILDVNKNTKQIGYKLVLEEIIGRIKSALDISEIEENMPVYKACLDDSLNVDDINVFNINPVEEIEKAIRNKSKEINLYKINLSGKTNCIPYTNIIFYDNQNKTLPVGMDLSTSIMVDVSKLDLIDEKRTEFSVINVENEEEDFFKPNINTINVIEYNISLEKN